MARRIKQSPHAPPLCGSLPPEGELFALGRPGGKKQEALATRERILDAAEQCYCTLGVSATTTALIASRAGCTRGAVYWHFRNQTDILRTLLERGRPQLLEQLERMAATVQEPAQEPVFGALRDCLAQSLHDIANDAHARSALEIMLHRCDFSGAPAAELLSGWRQEQERLLRALRRILAHAQRRGELGEGQRVDTCVALICFILVGAFKFQVMQGGESATFAHEAGRALDAALEYMAMAGRPEDRHHHHS